MSFLFRPIFQGRYLLCCVVPLILLVSATLAGLRPQALFHGALTLFLALAFYQDVDFFIHAPSEDWPAVARYVDSAPKDTVLICSPSMRWEMDYYLNSHDRPPFLFPAWDERFAVLGHYILDRHLPYPTSTVLKELPAHYDGAWLVETHLVPYERDRRFVAMAERELGRAYCSRRERVFGSIKVLHYTSCNLVRPIAERLCGVT